MNYLLYCKKSKNQVVHLYLIFSIFYMLTIEDNLRTLRSKISPNVTLIAVSKMQSNSNIMRVYNEGQRKFAENRVQDLVEKQPLLPADIEWHFIGHLQTNKVKYIAPFIKVIQSVDSLKLLQEIDKEAMRNERIIDCMLEIFIATEETKYGLDITEVKSLFSSAHFKELHHVHIIGVMGMATFSTDTELINREFQTLKGYFDAISIGYFRNDPSFREISMGMSGDYEIAIKQGSTMLRIGSAIFNEE
jgi:PLP dependent protein